MPETGLPSGLAFPIPQASVPGFGGIGFGGLQRSQIGYGLNFPDVFGIGTKGVEIFGQLLPFAGPSPSEATKFAVARLRESQNPSLRTLATQLAHASNQFGINLSTSNPSERKILGSYVHQAVLALEAQGIPRTQAYNSISNIISHNTGGQNVPAPARPVGPSMPMMSFGTSAQDFMAPFARKALPAVGGFVGEVAGGAAEIPMLESGIPPLQFAAPAAPFVGRHIGREIGQAASNYLFPPTATDRSSLIGQPPPSFGPGFAPGTQPGQVPTLQDCPECGYFANQGGPQPMTLPLPQGGPGQLTVPGPQGGDVGQEIQQLERQVGQEIQTETQQSTQQQLGQIQQQLDRLRQLETQPIQSRDVQQELQQKQAIQQQLQQLAQGQPVQQGVTPSNTLQHGETPTLNYEQPQLEEVPTESHPLQAQQPLPGSPGTQGQPGQHVTVCVACTSHNEALKFLNGEPSECSIMP